MAQHMIIAGGSGFIGQYLARHFVQYGYRVSILSRQKQIDLPEGVSSVLWDGKQSGPWQMILDGADVLINLAGKSVNCRYTPENRQAIHDSRVDSTRILGKAIKQCKQPPRVWLNASTATIYRYSEDKDMTEATGELVDDFSTSVAKDWEAAFFGCKVPHTRQVALRMSIILAKDDGALPRMVNLARTGLGGAQGHGRQYVSWLHIEDLLRIID
ncbi:MAG: NAD-dependent epimerase/dehydratase family protein, partial [Bacteroidota bacterium]